MIEHDPKFPTPRDAEPLGVMLRRRFVNILLGISGVAVLGGILYPIIQYLMPPKNAGIIPGEVEVGPESKFTANSGVIFRFGDKPGILIRTPDGMFKAFSAVCTHLGCTVEYRADHKDIYCNCHGGIFDINGKNIGGPPPKPLESFKVLVKNGVIYVAREEGKA